MFESIRARHRWTYIWLALKHFTTPGHVYNIAHGKSTETKKDQEIRHELHEKKIIHHHHHHHFS